MSWIREIDQGEAEGDLGELYADIVAKRGKVANILKVHSLNPGALKTHGDLYLHLLFGRSRLSRAEREAAKDRSSLIDAQGDDANRASEKIIEIRKTVSGS